MNTKAEKEVCCDRYRMGGYVVRRAKAMLDEIGEVEFNIILEDGKPSRFI